MVYDCIVSDETILSAIYENNSLFLATSRAFYEIAPHKECRLLRQSAQPFLVDALDVVWVEKRSLAIVITPKEVIVFNYREERILLRIVKSVRLAAVNEAGYLAVATHDARVFLYRLDAPFSLGRVFSFEKEERISALECYASFVAAGSFFGTLKVVDIYTKELVYHDNNLSGISALCFLDKDRLLLGHTDASLSIIEISTRKREVKTLPFCQAINGFLVEEDKVFIEAKEQEIVVMGKENLLIEKMSVFNTPTKRLFPYTSSFLGVILQNDQIVFTLKSFYHDKKATSRPPLVKKRALESFEALYKEAKYSQAFMAASKEPSCLQSPLYAQLEERFWKLFALGVRYVRKGEMQKAQEILGEYVRVPIKGEIVRLLLRKKERFILFLQTLAAKDFQSAYTAVQKEPKLAKIAAYKALEEDVQKRLEQIQKEVLSFRFHNEAEVSQLAAYYPDAALLQERITHLHRLEALYEANRFKECFELVDTLPFLKDSLLGELLRKHWIKTVQKAEEAALKGEIKTVVALFGELLFVASKKEKITDILTLAARMRIVFFMEKGEFLAAEKGIYEYIDLFGYDWEIARLCAIFYEKTGHKVAFMDVDRGRSYRWLEDFRDDWV